MAIRYAFSAWQAVSAQVIRKCFTHSGFSFDNDEFDDDDVPLAQLIASMEDEIPLAHLRMTTKTEVSIKQFEEADMSLITMEQRTEDEIVSGIISITRMTMLRSTWRKILRRKWTHDQLFLNVQLLSVSGN